MAQSGGDQSFSQALPCLRRAARAAGSVVVIATSPDDPSVEAASLIAAAAGERLVVVDVRTIAGHTLRFERKREVNEPIRRIEEGPADYAAEAAPHALRGLTERLTVVSRGTIRNEVALAIALARGGAGPQPRPKASRAQRLRGRPRQATRPSPSRATL